MGAVDGDLLGREEAREYIINLQGTLLSRELTILRLSWGRRRASWCT